jgi:mgtE-like transporter
VKRIKNLLKMIRHIISSIISAIITTTLFLFKNINLFFKFLNNGIRSLGGKLQRFYNRNKHILKEGLAALIICAIGDLFAGIVLGNMTGFLAAFPGLLVIIPGAIGMRGSIFGSFASRLSSNLHIGTISPEFKKSDILTQNILSSIILTLLLSLFLPILAKILCIIFNFDSMNLIDFTLISLFAGLISSFIMLPITMFISLKSFENGWDPDNVTTPLVAAIGDLFTLPSIILSIFIVVFIDNEHVKLIIFVILLLIIIIGVILGIRSKGESKTIISQSTPVLMFSSFLGVFAGGVLNSSVDTLLKNPTLLTLVPLFSGESGSLISILGARMSSALHSGLIEPLSRPSKGAINNFVAILFLGMFIFPFIGILAEASSVLLGIEGLSLIRIIPITFISGFIVLLVMITIVYYISTISFRKGLDPDNIVLPISTSVTDLIANLSLISVSLLILI